MAIDTSIYNNIQTPQMPDPMAAAQKAMSLGELGMKNQQMQLQLQTQQAMRQAYQNNRNPDGSMNREGMLSDLGQVNPQAAMEMQQHFVAQDKAQAEAQTAQMIAMRNKMDVGLPVIQDLLTNVPKDQQATVYPKYLDHLKSEGIDFSQVLPSQFDERLVNQFYTQSQDQKEAIDKKLTQSQTAKAQGEADAIPATIAEKQAQTAKALADAEKTRSETYKRNPDILGQTNDPAKLVPGYVPKEHQAKVFGEIDAAENTKRMSKSIMDSFDKAVTENTVMKTGGGIRGTIFNPPASVLALHQAMQPTFKDMEGTVRQAAMDNTFRNVTPTPGDSQQTIAEKRQALQSYLQSKASAPTARAYGIDLAKFDSTSAYQSPTKTKSPPGGGSSFMGGNTANASESAPGSGGFSLDEIRAEIARRNGGKRK